MENVGYLTDAIFWEANISVSTLSSKINRLFFSTAEFSRRAPHRCFKLTSQR